MTEARDWRTLPLAGDGRTLVEASAGTGKTWTIGALYLRLLLEDHNGQPPLSPRQIVVATYTNAAADELRRRLRGRLLETLDLAANGVVMPTARTAMASPEIARHLADIQLSATSLGLRGTPTFFINGRATASIDPAEVNAAIEAAKKG